MYTKVWCKKYELTLISPLPLYRNLLYYSYKITTNIQKLVLFTTNKKNKRVKMMTCIHPSSSSLISIFGLSCLWPLLNYATLNFPNPMLIVLWPSRMVTSNSYVGQYIYILVTYVSIQETITRIQNSIDFQETIKVSVIYLPPSIHC